jgi:uncharacterized membrane protein
MSLVSMVDTKLASQQAQDKSKPSPDQPIGVSTSIANQITRWIPTETISVYVALLALLAPLAQHSPSFTSRWVLFWLMTAANPVVVVLLVMAKKQPGTRLVMTKKRQSGGDPLFPWFEIFIASIAFAAWAFALPDTPLNSVSGYSIRWNAAILTVTTAAISLVANALHKSPDFDQVITKQQGANPQSLKP